MGQKADLLPWHAAIGFQLKFTLRDKVWFKFVIVGADGTVMRIN